jgi:hypothetical protein
MGFLQLDEGLGRYRIRCYLGGQEFKPPIETKDEKIVRGIQPRAEETIRPVEHRQCESMEAEFRGGTG